MDFGKTENLTLETGLRMLNIAGVHPKYSSVRSKIFLVVGICLTFILFNLIHINLFLGGNNIHEITETIEASVTILQQIIKQTVLMYFRKDLLQLLNELEGFWKIEDFTGDIKAQVLSILHIEFKLIRAFFVMILTTLICFYGKFFINYELPLHAWVPDKYYLNLNNIYILQLVQVLYLLCVAIGYDLVFSSLCVRILIQFKLLGHTLSTVTINMSLPDYDERKCLLSFADCVHYHERLLKFIMKLNKINSLFFLTQIGFTTFTLCMELYIGSEVSVTDLRFAKYALCSLCVVFQLCYYCIPADLISEEAYQLSTAVYSCEWYSGDLKFQPIIGTILMRTQKPLIFSAGGMVNMNRETLSSVMKTAFSIYTLLKQIKSKK